ncbi:GDSL-type esterase/lipase family protein [Nocardia arthritidis]|nr:GDSL-type esterase/lipase family protein [Nocardia arthritidis]
MTDHAHPEPVWVGAWRANPSGSQGRTETAPEGPRTRIRAGYPMAPAREIADQSLRMIATVRGAGAAVRITLSNRYGRSPVTFREIHLGRQRSGADLVPGSNTRVTFAGADEVTVAAGAEAVSDPVSFPVQPLDRLAVSFHLPQPKPVGATNHWLSTNTSYLSAPRSGNHAAAESGTAFTETTRSVYHLSGIDVLAAPGTSAVVVLGDSFTESNATTLDGDQIWPDHLTRRLQTAPGGAGLSVVSSAISFNFAAPGIRPTLIGPRFFNIGGPAGTQRFGADVAAVPGATAVIILLGMNDLGFFASAHKVIDAYRNLVDQAHAAGLKAIGGTLTPTGGAFGLERNYGLRRPQRQRDHVNEFIRTGGLFDGVIDFAAATADPTNPRNWAPGLSPDEVHPNDQGARIQADAVDLTTLRVLTAARPSTSASVGG